MKPKNTLLNTTLVATGLLLAAYPAQALGGDCEFIVTSVVTPATCGQSNGAIDITVNGGTAPYYFTWSTGSLAEDISGLAVGSYWVFVADFTQCYYKVDIEVTCEEEVNCQFRTQTQGGWGAPPNGNNPAMYLQNNFASCFPNGITIGCQTANTLTLTTSTAVKNFLPSGSTPSQLPNDMVNPGGGYKNVLAGQLVAATINVTVDACDPNFSLANGWSGNTTYAGGTFAGMTVAQVIAAANTFIGGCGGAYTASQFNAALTTFNENYLGGTTDNGNLLCTGGETKSVASANGDQVALYPNPAGERLTVDMLASEAGNTEVRVLDLSGRLVMSVGTFAVEAKETRNIPVDISTLENGTYLMVVARNGALTSRPFVVQH